MLKNLLSLAVPPWVRPALLAAAAASLYMLGVLRGVTTEGQKHVDYVIAQSGRSAALAAKQIQIVHDVEIQYRDRIRTIHLTGEKNVEAAPQLVTADDSRQCTVNAGFVRLHDAAWTNSIAAPAAESDREPTAVSLTDIAEADADNAASCHDWREQAIGLRIFYNQLRAVTNPPSPGSP